ncbi:MAG: transcriptional regulator [Brevinematales bacterium]|jgi:hypothetical protein
MSKFNDPLDFQVREAFDRARNKAFFREILNKIFRKRNALFRFDEVKSMLSPEGMSYMGLQTIPINKIMGSEGRYSDFDINFLPLKDNNRGRWQNIELANLKDLHLPPILVYKIGDFYFVRDGNHRVSVAKEFGQEFIDADVVELFTKVGLSELSEKELLLAESHKYFLDKTRFDRYFPDVRIKLTNPWGYYRLIEHINTYKYFKSEEKKHEVCWEDSIKLWYTELFLPVTKLIKKRKILRKFPGREAGDLYIWLLDHWHYLKEKYGDVSLESALDDYLERFGRGYLGNLALKIRGFFNKFIK